MNISDLALLAEFDPQTVKGTAQNLVYRPAIRAVVFDTENRIALLDVTKQGYHKLPGGGIEPGEVADVALQRECLEEIGCRVVIERPIGRTIEYRPQLNTRQESFCYIARVDGNKGANNLMPDEIDDGFQILWVNIDTAITLLLADKPRNYSGGYIVPRDLLFLQKAKQLL